MRSGWGLAQTNGVPVEVGWGVRGIPLRIPFQERILETRVAYDGQARQGHHW